MTKTRKKKETTEYQKKLREFRMMSDRHVLVLEADVTSEQRY